MCAKYLLFKMLGESIASHGPAIRVNLPQASLYTCLNMIYRFGLHDKWLDENMQFHEKVLTVNGESMVSKPELWINFIKLVFHFFIIYHRSRNVTPKHFKCLSVFVWFFCSTKAV